MMNKEKFLKLIEDNKNIIDKKVQDYYRSQSLLEEAMLYASDGGKRIRAFLYLECKKMFSRNISEQDIDLALAIEFIHAYSLVHDDLPAMDDDDYRRGKESVHKKFGQDIAILTGDALLNDASIILFKLGMKNRAYLDAGLYILERGSKKGMIEGQVLDLRRENSYDIDYLFEVYSKKTSDLFKAACVAAAITSGKEESDIKKIENFAKNLGVAFQIQDDLLEDNFEDELNILNLMDKSQAEDLLNKVNTDAKQSIQGFKDNEILLYLIDYLTNRSY